jgi:zinc transporter ZupT
MGTSQTRSDLIWEELCKANDHNWPSLRILAAAVDQTHFRRGLTRRDTAEEDPLDYEVPPSLTVWALYAADRLFNGRARQGPESKEAPQDRGPTPMSPNSDGDPGCAFPAHVARAAHLQRVIGRVRPHLEVLLTTLGAAALHVFAGACLELVVMADIRTGVVVAILFAMRNFPEGVVFARDIIMISSAGEWGSPGRWPSLCRRALFAGAFVGLCDCLGASMALGVTKSVGKYLPRQVLGALDFVKGGFIVGLGILKHLRAAVACDPEQKLPAIAWMLGMVITGIMLLIIDDIAAMSAAR